LKESKKPAPVTSAGTAGMVLL